MRLTEPLVALVAGFVSFLAPCVLPLVPGYLSAVSAVEADRLGDRGSARRVVLASIPFVLGFTAVFVALGVGAQLARRRPLPRPVPARARRRASCSSSSGSPSWGCCRGRSGSSAPGCSRAPAVAARGCCSAARSRSARRRASARCWPRSSCSPARPTRCSRARSCSPCYSLGLAIPFVLAGALFTRAMGAFRWLRDHYRRDPVRQRRDHGRARAAALLRPLLRAADLPQPGPRAGRDRAGFF